VDGLLLFKLIFSPLAVAAATWLSRRLGPRVGGWIVALPLTSGPISVFFVIQHGREFAAQAAIGTMAGSASTCLFCLAYGLSARRWRWPASLGLALLTFFVSTVTLKELALGAWASLAVVAGALIVAWRLMPQPGAAALPASAAWWDIPMRMALVAGLILSITGLSNRLGPDWSGLLSPIPLLISLLTVFAHHLQGPDGAIRTLRGTLSGTIAFAMFFLVVTLALQSWPLAVTYGLATAVAIGVNTLAQWVIQ
jgi:hypothetical protein